MGASILTDEYKSTVFWEFSYKNWEYFPTLAPDDFLGPFQVKYLIFKGFDLFHRWKLIVFI